MFREHPDADGPRSPYDCTMADTTEPTVIYCYDGSEHARNALIAASRTLGDRSSVVVTVWRSGWTAIAAVPAALLPQETVDEIDSATEEAAQALAHEGAALIPGATIRCMRATGPVWQTILEYADEVDAELIVAGSRGLSAIKSTVLGSVSHGLVNHSRRPVLVVPGQ